MKPNNLTARKSTMKQPYLDKCPCCNVDLRNECLPKPKCKMDLRHYNGRPEESFQLSWICTMCGCMWDHGEFDMEGSNDENK